MTHATPTEADAVGRLLAEGPIGMAAAARLLGSFGGDRPTHPSTVTRWAVKGVKLADGSALRLEAVRIGGRLATSHAAVVRFLVAQQEPGTPAPPPRGVGERRRASEEAARRLEAEGL